MVTEFPVEWSPYTNLIIYEYIIIITLMTLDVINV